jgi:phosphonate degradation associated HDIG domain protein
VNELSSIEDIERLYATHGGLAYGEGVTQMEHAVQCATLAQVGGGTPSFIIAALLHDIGHFFVNEADGLQADDRHQIAGSSALAAMFGADVCEPIALHVAAKRYLCFKDMHYFEALSPASKQSLKLQGGPFDEKQATAFEQMPYWQGAVALRRFDDRGKREEKSPRTFADFVPSMRGLITTVARF